MNIKEKIIYIKSRQTEFEKAVHLELEGSVIHTSLPTYYINKNDIMIYYYNSTSKVGIIVMSNIGENQEFNNYEISELENKRLIKVFSDKLNMETLGLGESTVF